MEKFDGILNAASLILWLIAIRVAAQTFVQVYVQAESFYRAVVVVDHLSGLVK
jgi:hypothetical protein